MDPAKPVEFPEYHGLAVRRILGSYGLGIYPNKEAKSTPLVFQCGLWYEVRPISTRGSGNLLPDGMRISRIHFTPEELTVETRAEHRKSGRSRQTQRKITAPFASNLHTLWRKP